jgi:hypothetical protein
VIGLSPFLEKTVKDEVFRRLISFVLEEIPPGSAIAVYDAYHLRTLTEIEVPTAAPFRSAKTRANQFRSQLLSLKQFLAAEPAQPLEGGPSCFGAVRLPQFLDFIRKTKFDPNAKLSVLVLGSPLYLDAREPQFSMIDGFFPADGHLRVGRDKSVYGIAGLAAALQGVAVHWACFGDPWVSDLHREKVARFWQLFLEGQGAALGTFSGDLATAFKNTRRSVDGTWPGFAAVQLDPNQTKVEMLRISREVAVTDWIRSDEVATSTQRPAVTVGQIKIGIRWSGNWDLDLYASAAPGCPTLFFQQPRSPEGYYYRDHRSSPGREFEFIEFTSPVDVTQVEASVNFYRGSAPGGPSGEVRVEFDGRIYGGAFHIPASSGNRGQSDPSQAKYWVRVNLAQLLHLAPGPLGQALAR